MEDIDIIALYFRRSEAAITETDQKYGRYCYSISHNMFCPDYQHTNTLYRVYRD